ncbi:RTA1 domain-containing protein [Aspergillus stella-maris]|uniref:RTA1 domain-containing protein n=1 Tax=Aspergillus stella-maris TaxID=1810926 RepID=UPI003CCDD64F
MANCTPLDGSGWAFCPNLPAAALFTTLYGLCFFLHLYLTFKTRKKFCWVITMGCAWLTVGFGLRAKAAHRIEGLQDFIPQSTIIFLGPLWLNGFVYMVMGRMVHMLLERDRIYNISARRLTLIFVLLDVVAFIVQASSTGPMSSDNPDTAQNGVYIMMGGVALQQSFITFFVVLAVRFHYKLLLGLRSQPDMIKRIIHTVPWRRLLYALYITLILITIRNIFRLIEFSDGVEGYIAVHEAFFYALDALPIFAGLIVMAVVHPSCVLQGPDSEFAPREKNKDRKRRRRRSRGKERENDGEELTERARHTREISQV